MCVDDSLLGNAECAVAIGILFGKLGAEVACGGIDVDLAFAEAAFKLGVAGFDVVRRVAGDDDDQVGFGSTSEFARFGGGFRKALGEPLEVVDEFCALL